MKTKPTLLIIADTLDLDSSSGAKASMGIVQSLAHCGYSLKVLHYSRKPVAIDGVSCVAIPEKKFSLYYVLSKLQIVLNRYARINLNPFIEKKRGFSYNHTFDVGCIKKAIKKERPEGYDWILALSYAGSFRAHKAITALPEWHDKFIPYVHDPYPQASYPRPYDWVEPGHQEKRDFFLDVCQAARYVMYPSTLLAEWMESYYHVARGKRVVIPHQFSQESTDGSTIPSFFKADRFSIIHAGSLMMARNPMALATAFAQLCEELPRFRHQSQLIFVGHPSTFQEPLETLRQQCDSMYIHPEYLPFNQVLPMQYQASVNVILEAKAPYSPFLPGKVPHCVVANKPILLLGPPISETRRILGDTYPYWAENDDFERIKSHLKALFERWEEEKRTFDYGEKVHFYFKPAYFKSQLDNLQK